MVTESKALGAYGTTLSWDEDDPIAEIQNISGPSIKIDTIDVTSHDSGSGNAFREFVAGLADGGEISLECNFIPGNTSKQKDFIDDAMGRESKKVLITLPIATVTTWEFMGIVTSLDFTAPHDAKLGFSATIKVTGKPSLLVGASVGMSALEGVGENAEELIFVPIIDADTYIYSAAVETGSSWVKLLPTAEDQMVTFTVGSNSQTIGSGAQSGELALGDADSVTLITIKVQKSGKVAKTYKLYVTRPAALP